jgi:hypothetical protein
MSTPLLPTAFSGNWSARRPGASQNVSPLFGQQQKSNNLAPSVNNLIFAQKADSVHFGREEKMNHAAPHQGHSSYDAGGGYDHVSYDEALGKPPGYYNAQADYQKQIMGKTAASLNRIVKGVGAGLGGFLVTAGFTALLALPAAGFVAIVGCVPLMHWLWPIAAGIATMPLILGGIVGGIKGLMGILRK